MVYISDEYIFIQKEKCAIWEEAQITMFSEIVQSLKKYVSCSHM